MFQRGDVVVQASPTQVANIDQLLTASTCSTVTCWQIMWHIALRHNAAVITQEVQSNHFDNFLSPELQKAGYTAIYKRKTTELYTGNAYAIDGCATFFKRDKFALVKKYEVRQKPGAGSPACINRVWVTTHCVRSLPVKI